MAETYFLKNFALGYAIGTDMRERKALEEAGNILAMGEDVDPTVGPVSVGAGGAGGAGLSAYENYDPYRGQKKLETLLGVSLSSGVDLGYGDQLKESKDAIKAPRMGDAELGFGDLGEGTEGLTVSSKGTEDPLQGATKAEHMLVTELTGTYKIPQHIAEGMVGSWIQESNLNPGINEAAPLVPGSRGGFGLAQWTGDRRTKLESYAQETGRPLDDPRTQMAYHIERELLGDPYERSKWEKVQTAKDAREAARLYTEHVLRPSPAHANYAGREANAERLAALGIHTPEVRMPGMSMGIPEE